MISKVYVKFHNCKGTIWIIYVYRTLHNLDYGAKVGVQQHPFMNLQDLQEANRATGMKLATTTQWKNYMMLQLRRRCN